MIFQPEPLSRRRWLQLASASLGATATPFLAARESYGRWDDESIARYSKRLMDWLRADFEGRAERLAAQLGAPVDLGYDYLAPSDDRRKRRMLEEFEEGTLPRRAAEKHIDASLTEFEKIRAKLAAAEVGAAAAWKPDEGSVVVKDGRIYDQRVSAARLSVILDSSPSMKPYLDKLREEIRRDFADAHFVEVNGCQLQHPASSPWFFARPVAGINPFAAERHIPRVPQWDDRPYSTYVGWTRDTLAALKAASDLMHSDAVYWFCDFEDPSEDAILRDLGRHYLAKKVTLFVHTLSRQPPQLVGELVKRSGGQLIRKRI